MTVYFVKTRKKASQANPRTNKEYPTSAYLLVSAKKMNLRIPEELSELTMQEFYDMLDLYFDSGENQSNRRMATQADIDHFMG